MSAFILLALMQFPLDVFENPGAFTRLEDRDGVVMSERALKNSVYKEYRAQIATTHPIDALCEASWEWGTRKADGPALILNKLLQDGDDVRVVYNQISQPIVAKRDYVLTVMKERLPDGSCRVRFRTTNELAPPKPDGFVRMDKLWGEWLFEAVPAGGAKLTYTLFSDPAGSVPSFLVHGAQRKATRDAAVMSLEKTKKYLEAAK
ncbi:MAG: START domain-containing protein [Archangium sp.]|nr:START domain-containing protein [Archangium sp.]MDP3155714.1 START domain-containing protein [Archangium sp.]MDP3571273.1 START domain-containing protein [Archangium sp.]